MALIKPPFDLEAYKRKIFGYSTRENPLFDLPWSKQNVKGYIPADEAVYFSQDGYTIDWDGKGNEIRGEFVPGMKRNYGNMSALQKGYHNNLTSNQLNKSITENNNQRIANIIANYQIANNNKEQEKSVSKWGIPEEYQGAVPGPADAGSSDIMDYYVKGNRSVKRKVLLPNGPYKIATVDNTNNYVTSLFNPIPRPSAIEMKEIPVDNSFTINKTPLSMDPNKVTGITDLSVDNGSSSDVENNLVNDLVASSEKSIKEQKNYNLFKTISDAIQTGGAMIGNATAKRPEPIRPPVVIPPTYESNLEENKNLIDRNMAGSLAAGIKMARETGRPELIPSLIANLQSGENTAYNQIAQNEIAQQNAQEVANTEAINKNAELGYGAKIQDAEMMDKINATRSELLAKMGTSLFSTIPNNYMQNKQSLVDMGNKTQLYKYLIDSGLSGEALINAFNMVQNGASYDAIKKGPEDGTKFNIPGGGQAVYVGGKYYKVNAAGDDFELDANGNKIEITQ